MATPRTLFTLPLALLLTPAVSAEEKLTPPLPYSHLLPRRQLNHLHTKFTSQQLLRRLKDRLELSSTLFTKYLGTDIRAPDG